MKRSPGKLMIDAFPEIFPSLVAYTHDECVDHYMVLGINNEENLKIVYLYFVILKL